MIDIHDTVLIKKSTPLLYAAVQIECAVGKFNLPR